MYCVRANAKQKDEMTQWSSRPGKADRFCHPPS